MTANNDLRLRVNNELIDIERTTKLLIIPQLIRYITEVSHCQLFGRTHYQNMRFYAKAGTCQNEVMRQCSRLCVPSRGSQGNKQL